MSSHSGSAVSPVLHFPVNVRFLPSEGVQLRLVADARERAALAAAHDVPAVLDFAAVLHVRPWKKQGVRVEGQIKARLEQPCSITAELLQNSLDADFTACFVPQNSRLAKLPAGRDSGEVFLDPEGEDIPEIFSGHEIDVGALAEEFFELEIDRYPRRPGAFSAAVAAEEEGAAAAPAETKAPVVSGKKGERPASPFAVLTHLKKR